jgi:hypothetical protein
MLRQRKLQQEAQAAREGILAGYQDAIAGRTLEFEGNMDLPNRLTELMPQLAIEIDLLQGKLRVKRK